MAYRKLGRTNKHRRSMLANLTKEISYGKDGSLVARRKALAFLHNDKNTTSKIFDELAPKYANRNGGYTRILKLTERRGDDALMVILELVEEDNN